MIVFGSQYEENAPKVIVRVHSDSTLPDVISAFESFLKATGYSFDGRLEIVEDVWTGDELRERS